MDIVYRTMFDDAWAVEGACWLMSVIGRCLSVMGRYQLILTDLGQGKDFAKLLKTTAGLWVIVWDGRTYVKTSLHYSSNDKLKNQRY